MIAINLFYMLPAPMREWVESLGPVENIQDVEISRDCVDVESYRGNRIHVPTDYVKVKVTIATVEHCCVFIPYEGQWMPADKSSYILYPGKHETVVQKEEVSDTDAFDLMDRIRDELWK